MPNLLEKFEKDVRDSGGRYVDAKENFQNLLQAFREILQAIHNKHPKESFAALRKIKKNVSDLEKMYPIKQKKLPNEQWGFVFFVGYLAYQRFIENFKDKYDMSGLSKTLQEYESRLQELKYFGYMLYRCLNKLNLGYSTRSLDTVVCQTHAEISKVVFEGLENKSDSLVQNTDALKIFFNYISEETSTPKAYIDFAVKLLKHRDLDEKSEECIYRALWRFASFWRKSREHRSYEAAWKFYELFAERGSFQGDLQRALMIANEQGQIKDIQQMAHYLQAAWDKANLMGGKDIRKVLEVLPELEKLFDSNSAFIEQCKFYRMEADYEAAKTAKNERSYDIAYAALNTLAEEGFIVANLLLAELYKDGLHATGAASDFNAFFDCIAKLFPQQDPAAPALDPDWVEISVEVSGQHEARKNRLESQAREEAMALLAEMAHKHTDPNVRQKAQKYFCRFADMDNPNHRKCILAFSSDDLEILFTKTRAEEKTPRFLSSPKSRAEQAFSAYVKYFARGYWPALDEMLRLHSEWYNRNKNFFEKNNFSEGISSAIVLVVKRLKSQPGTSSRDDSAYQEGRQVLSGLIRQWIDNAISSTAEGRLPGTEFMDIFLSEGYEDFISIEQKQQVLQVLKNLVEPQKDKDKEFPETATLLEKITTALCVPERNMIAPSAPPMEVAFFEAPPPPPYNPEAISPEVISPEVINPEAMTRPMFFKATALPRLRCTPDNEYNKTAAKEATKSRANSF